MRNLSGLIGTREILFIIIIIAVRETKLAANCRRKLQLSLPRCSQLAPETAPPSVPSVEPILAVVALLWFLSLALSPRCLSLLFSSADWSAAEVGAGCETAR